MSQDSAKMGQYGAKMPQDAAMIGQDGAKEGPRRGPRRNREKWENMGRRRWPTWDTPSRSELFRIDLNRFAPTAIQRFSASGANWGHLWPNGPILVQLGTNLAKETNS